MVFELNFLQFLSMKLASVNPRLDFEMENLLSKDVSKFYLGLFVFIYVRVDLVMNWMESREKIHLAEPKIYCCSNIWNFWNMICWVSIQMFQENGNLSQPLYPLDSSAPAFYHHQPKQNVQLHDANFSRGPLNQCSMDPLDAHNVGIQLSSVDGFGERLSQVINCSNSKILFTILLSTMYQTCTINYAEMQIYFIWYLYQPHFFQFPAFDGHDLQSIVQMGFGQDPVKENAFHSGNFQGKDKKDLEKSISRINIV